MDDSQDNLPHTARSLCQKALEIGNELIATVDQDALVAEIKEFSAHAAPLADKVENGKLSIDATNIHEVFAAMSSEDSANKLFDELGTEDNPQLAESLNKPTAPEIGPAFIGWALVATVQKLKQKEIFLLESDEEIGFEEIMGHLDDEVMQIATLLSSAKAFKPGMELIATKLSRKKGARKGGQARQEKYSELHSMVVEEAKTLHAEKKGAKAARDIHAKFSANPSLLNDENGKPLSVDPVPLFTEWINEDRRKARSSK